jgi:shikimate 5-dehydrogenase
MFGLRYAVGGAPVGHTLSPILFDLVLSYLKSKGHFRKLDLSSLTILETSHIDEVLGWAYIEHDKHQPIWKPANQKVRTFHSHLTKHASEVLHHESDATLAAKLQPKLGGIVNANIPDGSSSNEVWLNLTSPLKHQIQSMVFTPIDESLEILSVNALRYDGQGWYCATTDGLGVVHVASHFGIQVSNGAILGVYGGGGAARSIASAWLNHGGKVVSLGGKRQLPATLVNLKMNEGTEFDLIIDAEGMLNQNLNSSHVLNPVYSPMRGSFEERIELLSTNNNRIDGRWMLAAQHLECWRSLWTPHLSDDLPSLEELMTWLVAVECKLEQN